MAMLQKIADNQNDILKRVESLEASQGPLSSSSPVKECTHLSYNSNKSANPTPVVSKPGQASTLKQYEEEGIIPSLQFLRSADDIQKRVQERIHAMDQAAAPHISGKPVLKSGRFRTAEAHTQKLIPWPHEFSYTGPMRKTVNYDELDPLQFIIGYNKIVLMEPDVNIRQSMLKYITKLMQDALDYSWEAARSANACLLTEMERGVVSWKDETELDKIRALYMNRNSVNGSSNSPKEKSHNMRGQMKKNICHLYNRGTCKNQQDHTTAGNFYKHSCAFCYKMVRKDYNHSEMECLHKQKHSKD